MTLVQYKVGWLLKDLLLKCRLKNCIFLHNSVFSQKWSKNQQKLLWNAAFHVKTSQLDPARKNRPKERYRIFLHKSLQLLYLSVYYARWDWLVSGILLDRAPLSWKGITGSTTYNTDFEIGSKRPFFSFYGAVSLKHILLYKRVTKNDFFNLSEIVCSQNNVHRVFSCISTVFLNFKMLSERSNFISSVTLRALTLLKWHMGLLGCRPLKRIQCQGLNLVEACIVQ